MIPSAKPAMIHTAPSTSRNRTVHDAAAHTNNTPVEDTARRIRIVSGWWVHDFYQSGDTVLLLSLIFWVIFSICLHELAHGWAAIWQGDNTPRELGRMTMNPMVHMGPMSLLVFALIGIAWGLMPTNPARYRWKRRGHIVVSAAGPAMNILIAFVALTIAGIWRAFVGTETDFTDNVGMFFWAGGWINIVLAGFNLLPIPPLDGSGILSGLSFRCYQLFRSENAMMFSFFVLIVLYMTKAFSMLFAVAAIIADTYASFVRAILSFG